MLREWTLALVALGVAVTPGAMPSPAAAGRPDPRAGGETWAPRFPGDAVRLVTNEYAYWNPDHADAVIAPDWLMTSGSLFARRGHGWSGKPDGGSPDAASRSATGSAVFRLHTRRDGYENVRVSFRLRVTRLVSTRRTPAVAWDGVHVWLRYRSQRHLYVASVFRRDGTVLVKRKTPGGPNNGGTYETLGDVAENPITMRRWHRVVVSARTIGDRVRLSIAIDGRLVDAVDDRGTSAGEPILGPGAVGIRGDNAEFSFADLRVTRL